MKRKLTLRNKSTCEEGMTAMGSTEVGTNSFQSEQNTTVFLTPVQALIGVLRRKRAAGSSHPDSPGSLARATHSTGTQVLSEGSRFGGQPWTAGFWETCMLL